MTKQYKNTNHQLKRKLIRRKLIAHLMPQSKAEARQACEQAALEHAITKLPPGKPPQTKRGNRINHRAFEATR